MLVQQTALPSALCLLILATLSTGYFNKRSEVSPLPFVMGSRYGRSSGVKLIAPRNDRFFMSGRYGKRSGGGVSSTSDLFDVGAREIRDLVCEYTGVSPLYRCIRHKRNKRDHYDVRIGDGSDMIEEV